MKTKKQLRRQVARTQKVSVLKLPMLAKYTHTQPVPNTGKEITQNDRDRGDPRSDPLSAKEGRFFELKEYPRVVRDSCDVYGIQPDGSQRLLAKFRKSVLPKDACQQAYGALYKAAQLWTDNRGAAAGMLNLRNVPGHVGSVVKRGKFRVFYKSADGNKDTKGNTGNEVRSNIIGYYDRPDRNALRGGEKMNGPPCRQTAFTRDEVGKWRECQPLIHAVDRQFARLVPDRYKVQLARCRLTPKFQISGTAFSTVTVNYNYRTALHKDAGDLDEGFGNLVVLEKSKVLGSDQPGWSYEGGYLGFPRYGVCIDVRHGDFLAMDVHEWHGNTKMVCTCPQGANCRNDDHFGRMSLVFYLRKKMADCADH
jgi:hypothetical protein